MFPQDESIKIGADNRAVRRDLLTLYVYPYNRALALGLPVSQSTQRHHTNMKVDCTNLAAVAVIQVVFVFCRLVLIHKVRHHFPVA